MRTLGRRRPVSPSTPGPVELRFIDLFLLVVAALLFVIVALVADHAGNPAPPPGTLEVATDSLPVAVEGERYEIYLASLGGTGRHRWRLARGALPRGLSLEPDTGRLGGRPAAPGLADLTLEVSDALGARATRSLSLEVRANASADPLRTEAARIDLGTAVVNAPFRHEFAAAGGRPPYHWRVADGDPPRGLTLSPDGVLSGMLDITNNQHPPGEPWRFSVAVSDQDGRQRTQAVSLGLRPADGWAWAKALAEAFESGASFFVLWIVLPVIATSLAGLVLLGALGCRGGWAGPWRGPWRPRGRRQRGRSNGGGVHAHRR